MTRFQATGRPEDFEHHQPHGLIVLDVIVWRIAFSDQSPSALSRLGMMHIVGSAPRRIPKHLECLPNFTKSGLAPRLPVVWMKPACKQAIDPLHRLRIRIGTDLENLVVVGHFVWWKHPPWVSVWPGFSL